MYLSVAAALCAKGQRAPGPGGREDLHPNVSALQPHLFISSYKWASLAAFQGLCSTYQGQEGRKRREQRETHSAHGLFCTRRVKEEISLPRRSEQ